MKRILILWLCILCCLFPLCACSQPEKRIEDQMNLALEQLEQAGSGTVRAAGASSGGAAGGGRRPPAAERPAEGGPERTAGAIRS